jgi:MoaA/NifB/PqqE/SkfB family radical SAM enzyme
MAYSDAEEPVSNYLTVAVGFRCNNRCLSCMLRDVMPLLQPVSLEKYPPLLAEIVRQGVFSSIILSGAEVTLEENLPRYIEFTRSLNYFRRIRLQTNGRRLADCEYAGTLAKSGLDEAFVSVYGPNPRIHESLTRATHSFYETIQGIKNLNELGVRIITNTVITRLNYRFLPEIVEMLSAFPNIARMEFWNYWPMDEADRHDLLVSNQKLTPYLYRTVAQAHQTGQAILFKNIPECLLGKYSGCLDNRLPQTIIDDAYWDVYRKNKFGQCPDREYCAATECMGLTAAYQKKFGYDNISPIRHSISTG